MGKKKKEKKLVKEYNKAVYCRPVYLTYKQSTLCEMPVWMDLNLETDCWEKYQQLQICRWYTTLMAESEEELKSLLRVKEESEKAGLKLNIHKMKIMTSSPITFWQIEGEKVETVTDFIFLGSKIIADGNCRH